MHLLEVLMLNRNVEGSAAGRKRPGFTLIELLMVIAIISLLAAILFPVFVRARENARRATCQSNLKQMSLGILQYVQDDDEYYPLWSQCVNGNTCSGSNGWVRAIQSYVKNEEIFQCPSELTPPGPGLAAANPATNESDYFYNFNIGGNANNDSMGQSRPSSLFVYTADTIMVGDNRSGGEYIYANCPPVNSCENSTLDGQNYYQYGTSGNIVDPTAPTRHMNSGANYGFADGHVKFLQPTVVVADAPNGSNYTFRVTANAGNYQG